MFGFLWQRLIGPSKSASRRPQRRPARARLLLESLEDRCTPSVTPIATLSHFTEGTNGTDTIAGFTDTDVVTPANFTNLSINWGDSTPADTTTGTVSQPNGGGEFLISGSHTYAEEGQFGVVVTVHDVLNNVNRSITLSSAVVGDAALVAGSAPSVTHTEFSGVGGTNAAGGTETSFDAFRAAIGGVKNTAASPQAGGRREITWDGVAVDGTDFGGNTTVVVPNKVVGIPLNRFQTQGSFFEQVYAVSADGFKSVNTNVNAASPDLFPAFSPTKTFAMFNDNTIDFKFVLPSGANTAPVDAVSRGFGAVFENVTLPNTTSIEYFSGDFSLGKFFVPVGTQGQNEFLGELFNQPVVSRITITLGTDVLFHFNGTTISSGGSDGLGHNLVVTDDFVFAEPTQNPIVQPLSVNPTVGTFFNGPIGTFTDLNAAASFHDFTGTINWGDSFTSPANFSALGSGKFQVIASHTFLKAGNFDISILVQDLGGSEITVTNTATVSGDFVLNGTAGNDTLTLVRTAISDVGRITFVLNGNSTSLEGVTSFTFNGFGGDDSMTVSAANGTPLVTGTVVFDGGANNDTVVIDAANLPVLATPLTFTVGSQVINYSNVELTNVNNAAAVNTYWGPDTADRGQLAGLTATERFVQALYLDVLGRAGARSELDAWVGVFNLTPGTQAQKQTAVSVGIEHSAEARRHLVLTWYVTYLGRQANNGEEVGLINTLVQTQNESLVLNAILASPEFYSRSQTLIATGTADERFVGALYQVLLNRTAAASEIAANVAALATVKRQGLANAFLTGTELRSYLVDSYYVTLLHRKAADSETAAWLGLSLDAVAIRLGFEESGEFFTNG